MEKTEAGGETAFQLFLGRLQRRAGRTFEARVSGCQFEEILLRTTCLDVTYRTPNASTTNLLS